MGRWTPTGKSFEIAKRLMVEAWEKVRANGGVPSVDAVTITDFTNDIGNHLYKLWNRMSAGSYQRVEHPRGHAVSVVGRPSTDDRVPAKRPAAP